MAHIHELYDFTVSAFIVHEDKVLLHFHKTLQCWMQPGGHIELNETPDEALWREIEEESGLKRTDLTLIETATQKVPKASGAQKMLLPFDINVHSIDDTHRHIDLNYLLLTKKHRVQAGKGESRQIEWLDRSQLAQKAKNNETPGNVYVRCLFALDFVKNTKT